MKMINLLFLFLPVIGFSQKNILRLDSVPYFNAAGKIEYSVYKWDTVPPSTTGEFRWDSSPNIYTSTRTEVREGKVKTSIDVMHSDLKVEVVESRDTVYECPLYYNSTWLVYDSNTNSFKEKKEECVAKEVITNRKYKMYIINEYGQKEYLPMEITKRK